VWFNIITQIIQTDICDRPNTRDGEGASNTYYKTRDKPLSINKLKSWAQETTNTPFGRKENTVPAHFSQNNEIQMKVNCQNAKWGCVLAHVWRYIKQNYISEDQLTLNWKSKAHRHK
jgi:hypothetical protein